MSEEPPMSIDTLAFMSGLLGGIIGTPIGHEMSVVGPDPVRIVIVGCIGAFIGIVPGFAISAVLRRLYREEALGAASSHRAFWMILAFASSAIFSAAAGAWLGQTNI